MFRTHTPWPIPYFLSFMLIVGLYLFEIPNAEAKRTYGMRPKVYTEIQVIQQLMDEKQWNQALTAIDTLQQRQLTSYELAQTWDVRGLSLYQKGDYKGAIKAYEQVLGSKEHIPEGMYQRCLRTVIQLSLMSEAYQQALGFAELLLQDTQDPDLYMLIAQAHFRLEQWPEAINASEQAMKLAEASGKKPRENWLLLQNAVYYGVEDYASMRKVLQKLLALYPKSDYVLYLANVHGELGATDQQTVLLESLHDRGLLNKPSELVNLASLYLLEKAPYKGAVLLEQAFDNGSLQANTRNLNLLVNAWSAAGDRHKNLEALSWLAETSDKGDDYLRLAYLHFDLFDWNTALASASKAIQKEDLKQPGSVWLLIGMCYTNLKHFDEAMQAFIKASRHDSSRKLAKQWLKYAEQEQEKYAAVDGYLNLASAR